MNKSDFKNEISKGVGFVDGVEKGQYSVNGIDKDLLESYRLTLERQGVNQREALELWMRQVIDGVVVLEVVERQVVVA